MSACACVAATSIACVPINPRHPAHERVAQRRRDKAICHCRQRMAVQRAGLGERLWRWCQHARRGSQKPAAYRAQMAYALITVCWCRGFFFTSADSRICAESNYL